MLCALTFIQMNCGKAGVAGAGIRERRAGFIDCLLKRLSASRFTDFTQRMHILSLIKVHYMYLVCSLANLLLICILKALALTTPYAFAKAISQECLLTEKSREIKCILKAEITQ